MPRLFEGERAVAVADLPSVNKLARLAALQTMDALDIEGNAGVTEMVIPKGLTPNMFLAALPEDVRAMIRYMHQPYLNRYGNIPVENSSRGFYTNNILNDTRNKPFGEQKAQATQGGCEVMSTLEAMMLLAFTYMESPPDARVRLYGDNPLTYTRCKEKVDGYRMVVGGFAPGGFSVSYSVTWSHPINGLGVLRKF